ncbi:hypothetical protein ACFYZU_27100 [Streptomyces sp. NPDC001651]|uniref:hypothetical protein n=1 Tax=Streptomyces sp. NPDC001651 TaxID=3364596 RepID=UPI00369FE651
MRTVLTAATGLPTLVLSAALVVAVCFWLLAAAGLAGVRSFDADVDLRGWGLDGVPVTVALSLWTFLAWSLSVGAAVPVAALTPDGSAAGPVLRLVVPVAALVVARSATRPLVRRLHRLFPDEPGPAARRAARTGTPTLRTRDRAV